LGSAGCLGFSQKPPFLVDLDGAVMDIFPAVSDDIGQSVMVGRFVQAVLCRKAPTTA
jgi:hypothetical protein